MGNVKIATQIFPMRNEAAKDLFSVLDSVRAIGYDGVEFVPGLSKDAQETRRHLDEIGLKAVSGHVSLDMLEDGLEQAIAHHKALGCEFIVLGWLAEEDRHTGPRFARTAAVVKRAAEACLAAGLPLAYHNHDFEFKHTAGRNGLEALLDAAPALQPQFDTGWLAIAGQDPLVYLARYAGRYASVHLKDYLASDSAGNHDFCPIGMGVMEYAAVAEAAVRGGAKWLIVDQDADARRPMPEALRLSLGYLKSLGI